jgi:SPP1 family predicted phage head-tail adaptor
MGRLSSGQLRERFTIITDGAPIPDGQGGNTPGAPTEEAVWADVEVVNAGERLLNGQIANYNGLRVRIRCKAGVTAKQRGRWNGQTVNIQAVVPDKDKEYLLLTCINGGQ